MAIDYPQRPETHETEDAAVRAFESQLPDSWATNPVLRDYGYDVRVILPRPPGRVGDEFSAQLKGTRAPDYTDRDSFLSQSLAVQTINWLLDRPEPTMLAVCDVSKAGRPVYWVWLDEAVEALSARNAMWKTQLTTTVRVPVRNLLAQDHSAIAEHVEAFHQNQRIARAVYRQVRPLLPIEPTETALSTPQDEVAVVVRMVSSALATSPQLEVAPIDARDLAQADQATTRRLATVAAFLREFQDTPAASELTALRETIGTAAPRVQASYHNCCGVLALHQGDTVAAIEAFRTAVVLDSEEKKYTGNLLTLEYQGAETIPDGWEAAVAVFYQHHPTFPTAVRLAASSAATSSGPNAAEDLLRRSSLFGTDPVAALLATAELHSRHGNDDHALTVLAEAETIAGAISDPFFHALKGNILFHNAIGAPRSAPTTTITGLGPSQLNVDDLHRSATAYVEACRSFASRGYPRVSQEIVSSAATVLVLARRFDTAERICRGFLDQHPDSASVHAALAMTLVYKGDPAAAVPHARIAAAGDDRSVTFKNLVLTLAQAEDFAGTLAEIRKRQDSGFHDPDEERLARELAAMAYIELGESTLAAEQLAELQRNPQNLVHALAVELLMARRQGNDSAALVQRIRESLTQHPNHPTLLTLLAHHLLPVTLASAPELISALTAITEHRQLAADEISALGRAYLLTRDPRAAERVFRSGVARYPTETRFLFDQAHALLELGELDQSYALMRRYVSAVDRDQLAYRNMGIIAQETGRLDEAIQMFSMAAARSTDPSEQGELHCQLFELRRRRGDSPKDILRHAVAYGRGTDPHEPDVEARFLMMCLITPLEEASLVDSEVQSWVDEIRRRLGEFTLRHPKFRGLTRISVPTGLSDAEQARHLFAAIGAQMLPGKILGDQVEMLVREGAWPLPVRHTMFPAVSSVFRYWAQCTTSIEFAHSIHIHGAPLDVDSEARLIDTRKPVCVDITALLTLRLLGLLDEFAGLFPLILVSRGTRRTITVESSGHPVADPIATDLKTWLIQNRRNIRIVRVEGVPDLSPTADADVYEEVEGIWRPRRRSLAELVGDGVGETLLIAEQERLHLYSDEVLIRMWAVERRVPSFSTLSLLRGLSSPW